VLGAKLEEVSAAPHELPFKFVVADSHLIAKFSPKLILPCTKLIQPRIDLFVCCTEVTDLRKRQLPNGSGV
jgi:hypothetical protein